MSRSDSASLSSTATTDPSWRAIYFVGGITALFALADANINILSITTSMSSVSCVIDQSRLDDTVAALKETFQLS